ncbi:MAG: glycosyltransferase [Candidatus Eremiobacteraeota bacterium]|nr:glycosyltransferase [Candidatus Eremiobacteraeota bacterium]
MKLRIVIPAYNEAARIASTLTDYCTEFRKVATVVVVANGCSDTTAAVVRGIQTEFENLALIDIPNAIGKGGAVRVGLAGGDEPYVGFVDADGSTSAAEFMRLFRQLEESGADALVGSRWLPQSRIATAQSGTRRLASRTFNAIVRLLFGLRIKDTQCGAKLFERKPLSAILPGLELADFAFDIEVLVRLQQSGCRIVEVPTVWADRAGTKIRLVRSSWSMLRSILRLRLRETPIWQIPLVDRFARRNVIPVKSRRRILVLGASAHPQPPLHRFFERLREANVDVLFAEAETGNATLSRWQALTWYAFRSRRDYDAVMEVAGRRHWIIGRLTSKPMFVVTDANGIDPVHVGKFRGGPTYIDLCAQQPHAAAELVLATVYADPAFPTVFVDTAETLSLDYADRGTGLRRSQVLRTYGEGERIRDAGRQPIPNGCISIVMPAFNESDLIAANLREVVATFERFNANFEVILVDDGSHDNTHLQALRVLVDHPEKIRILRYEVNQGKGNALMAGAASARGEFVVFLDSDMDIHPAQLPRYFEIMEEKKADAVIGSKRHPESRVRYPLIRQLYSTGYYALVRCLFGLPLRDTQTGLKLFRAELLRDVLPRVLAKRFAFDIEMLSIAHYLGYRIADAPVVLGFNRRYGRINYKEVWRIFLDTLAIFYRLRLLHYYDTKHNNFALTGSVREMSSQDASGLLGVVD